MTRERFNTLIADPLEIEELDGSELTVLSESYPWCQSGHVLLSVLGHKQHAPSFNDRLKRAAVHTVDREVLFNLMMRPTLESTVKAFEHRVEDEPDEDKNVTPVDPNETSEPQNSDVSVAGSTEQEVTEKEEKRLRAINLDELQREIVVEAISSTIKKEVEEVEEQDSEKDLPKSGESPDEVGSADSAKSQSVVGNERATDEVTPLASEGLSQPGADVEALELKATESGEVEVRHSAYASWLLAHSKQAKPADAPNLSRASVQSTRVESEPSDPKTKQLSLIDRFIESDPKITPGKAELFSTENLAKMSLVEDEEFVTETMAVIYARQGNMKKALKAYKLLSLKYPEKSIYFANQIKKLRSDGDISKKQ